MPKKKTTAEFISDAVKVHGDLFDYSLVEYVNSYTKVKIICLVHETFEQKPNDHLRGSGCQKCYGNQLKTTAQFIIDAIRIHGERYDYFLVKYMGSKNKITIVCKIHGNFIQTADDHLRGKGCDKCNHIRGEKHPFYNKNKIDRNKHKYDVKLNQWRKLVYERDNHTCQKCNDNKGGNLQAHHIKPYALYPELRYEVSNGVTFCDRCHAEYHSKFGFGTVR